MNWGKSIIAVYVIFVFGMVFLVYQSTQETFEVVDVDYYQREKEYSTQLDATNRANSNGFIPSVRGVAGSQQVVIPVVKNQSVSGEVFAYCPTRKLNDTKIPIEKINKSIDSVIAINLNRLKPSQYILKVKWKCNEEEYYSELPFNN